MQSKRERKAPELSPTDFWVVKSLLLRSSVGEGERRWVGEMGASSLSLFLSYLPPPPFLSAFDRGDSQERERERKKKSLKYFCVWMIPSSFSRPLFSSMCSMYVYVQ